jgi:hypothetical protein
VQVPDLSNVSNQTHQNHLAALLAAGRRPKQIKIAWSDDEQKLFLEGLAKHGSKKIKEIANHIGTRSTI